MLFRSRQSDVFAAMLANSWFWFFGAIVLAQFPVYARDVLHGEPEIFAVLLTAFSLGIGAGSLLCERLSGGRLQLGLVPLGSLGLTVFGIDLYFASLGPMPSLLMHSAMLSSASVRPARSLNVHSSCRHCQPMSATCSRVSCRAGNL